MAGHAGLQRVVKTVKSKKGSVHRAYWVNVAKSAGTVAGLSAAGGATHSLAGIGAAAIGSAVAINRRMGSGAAKSLQYARQSFATRAATDIIHVGAQSAGIVAGFVARAMLSHGASHAGSALPSGPNARHLNGHSRGGSGSNTHGY